MRLTDCPIPGSRRPRRKLIDERVLRVHRTAEHALELSVET